MILEGIGLDKMRRNIHFYTPRVGIMTLCLLGAWTYKSTAWHGTMSHVDNLQSLSSLTRCEPRKQQQSSGGVSKTKKKQSTLKGESERKRGKRGKKNHKRHAASAAAAVARPSTHVYIIILFSYIVHAADPCSYMSKKKHSPGT